MPQDLGQAVLSLVTDDSALNRGINQAKRDATGLDKSFARTSTNIVGHIRTIGVALGASFAVGTVINFVRSTISVAAAIQDAADAAGVGAEALQRLRFAGEQTGATVDQVDGSLQQFNRRLGEFRTTGGGEAKVAFEQLGLASEITAGKFGSTEEALNEILRRLADIPNISERAAVASKLFGETAGPRLAAQLNQGYSAFKRLTDQASVLSDENVKAAQKWDKAWKEMTGNVKTYLQENILTTLATTKMEAEAIIGVLLSVGKAIGVVDVSPIEALNQELVVLESNIQALESLQAEFAKGHRLLSQQELVDTTKELSALEARRVVILDQLAKRETPALEVLPRVTEAVDDLTSSVKDLGKATDELPPLDETRIASPAERFAGQLPGRKSEARFGGDIVGEPFLEPRLDPGLIRLQETVALLNAPRQTAEMDSLSAAFTRYAEAVSFSSGPLEGLIDLYGEFSLAMNGTAETQEQINARQQAALGDTIAFSSGALNELFGGFQAYAIAESIISTALAVSKALSAAPWPFNLVLAAAVGALGAAQTAIIASESFQRGGTFGAGLPFVAGEKGAELIMPKVGGRVFDAVTTSRLLQGERSSGGMVIQNLQIAPGADPAAIAAMEGALRRLNATVEQRSVAAVVGARQRNPSLFRTRR